MTAEIAIIEPNTLAGLGLRTLIERMLPEAIVRHFPSFEQFIRDTPDMYFHYFIAAGILMEHNLFFTQRRQKTIVMTNGVAGAARLANFRTLNVYQSEEDVTRALLRLHQSAHAMGRKFPAGFGHHQTTEDTQADPNGLSPREVEVLTLIVRGLANKAIAEALNISITTVISHRKNLMDKLNVRTVSGLTIYAVMNGYIEADRI